MTKINIQYYGFNFPPHSLISLLNAINFVDDKNFIIFDPLNGVELPQDQLWSISKENLYIIITTHEGASHLWFDQLLDQLINKYQIPQSNIVLRSGCLYNPDSPIFHIHTIADECGGFVHRFNHVDLTVFPTDTTHHYVCLNRLHRWQRYRLVKNLLNRGLDNFGKISYLDNPTRNDPCFPLVLDSDDISWKDQRDINNSIFSGALVNVITESAYEPEPGHDINFHHLPGMTEKSFKCFAMHQIPIWLAPHFSVNCYRNLGFDVFDDIIDHSYDLEPDPEHRINLVITQIEKLCRLSNLHEIRKKLKPRFLKNLDTLKFYSNHQVELPQWQKFFNLDGKD
jgi:hypothetical protein